MNTPIAEIDFNMELTLFNKVEGGYTGLTLSVRLPIHLSLCLSVHLWTELCPLCTFYNTHQIHFMFTHLIRALIQYKDVISPV